VAISARSRRSRTVSFGIASSSLRHSLPSSTGVLPVFTTCFGPRTAAAGLCGRIWPVISQSNNMRIAASCCFTSGAEPPQPPAEGPLPKDQINLTDDESRIMPVAGGGFEQCYNAQAVVAADSLLVIAADVVQAPNDKQQIEPMLNQIDSFPDELGGVDILLANTGYFSAANVDACNAAGIEPLIAMGRQPHHRQWVNSFVTIRKHLKTQLRWKRWHTG
jgi:hypothetical protein